MKIRNGFVSNSSTSSFIVLIKPDKVKDVDFILRHALRDVTPCVTVPERKKELRKEIRELGKDTAYTEKLVEQLDALFTDEAYDFHELCQHINLISGGVSGWRQARYGIRNYRTYSSPYKPDRNRYHNSLNDTLQNIADERARCERELEQITGNEDWSIISFEEDVNWGHLNMMINELVADGDAIVLHKETT